MKSTTLTFSIVMAAFATFGPVRAGSLNPPGAPAPTMTTLQQIYDKIGTGVAAVSRTGQSACWDITGAVIPCAGTGQDGEFQKGTSLSPRFTDNLNGTVKDNLTGLVWLKNANCIGFVGWTAALAASNSLASGSCGLTDGSVAGNWRLPNFKELQSLLDYGHSSPALPAGHPFSGVQPGYYWSSSTYLVNPIYQWVAYLDDGLMTTLSKSANDYVWPVRN